MLCSNCGKKEAIVMGLCQDCLTKKQDKYRTGITFEEFRNQYLQSPAEGLFWADDVLLDYAYYQDGHRFSPRLCGEDSASYAQEHDKLKVWYAENFYRMLLERIRQVSSEIDNIDFDDFKEQFIQFKERMNALAMLAHDRRVITLLFQRHLRQTFGRKLIEHRYKYPSPDIVAQAAATFDAGSGLFYLEIFCRMLKYDYLCDIFEYFSTKPKQLIESVEQPGLTIIPWRHQQEAIDAWVKNGHKGVVEMATATGKTLVGMLAIEELAKESLRCGQKMSVIVTCHSRIILNQWRRELIQKMGISAHESDSYKVPLKSGSIVIQFETVQSLSRHTSNYCADLLIVDEVHHLAGKSFRKALHIDCRWQLGLTAWLGQKEARRRLIEKELGKVQYKYSLHQALEDGIIPSFEWIVHPTYLNIVEEEEFERLSKAISLLFQTVRYDSRTINAILEKDKEKYRQIYPSEDKEHRYTLVNIGEFIRLLEMATLKGGIALPEDWKTLQALILKRRLIINKSLPRIDRAEELAKQLGNDHHVIIFLMDIESCERMRNHLKGTVENVFVIHSEIEEDPITVAAAFRNSKNGVLIGAKMLDEGIDIKNADIGINIAFAKSEIQLIQRMGRVLRREGDKRPTFYQFVAIPDKTKYLDIMDAEEFADDLAWVESMGLKMGLNLTVEWNSKELLSYKKDMEKFWRTNAGLSKIGTFDPNAAVAEFSKTAIKRIPHILRIYKTEEITDLQWDDIIRTAHTLVDENGEFVSKRKKRHININSAWYILVLCERKVSKLIEFFENAGKSICAAEEHTLPPLNLNEDGIICSKSLKNEESYADIEDDNDDTILFDSEDDLTYLDDAERRAESPEKPIEAKKEPVKMPSAYELMHTRIVQGKARSGKSIAPAVSPCNAPGTPSISIPFTQMKIDFGRISIKMGSTELNYFKRHLKQGHLSNVSKPLHIAHTNHAGSLQFSGSGQSVTIYLPDKGIKEMIPNSYHNSDKRMNLTYNKSKDTFEISLV